jgi:hypothetical protein
MTPVVALHWRWILDSKRYQFWTLIALSTLLMFGASSLTGCGDEATEGEGTTSGTDGTSGGTSGDSDGETSGTTSGDTSGTIGEPCTTSADCDTDGDGIPDAIEVATGTSFSDPDSDDDGMCDGGNAVEGVCASGEDFNNNGRFDPTLGESDPKNGDENGDSIPDGSEPSNITKGLVCNGATYNAVEAKPARSAKTNLALPTSFSIVEHDAAQASSFSDPATGIYGYVIKRTFNQNAANAFRDFETKIGTAGSKRKNAIWKLFTSWFGRETNLERNAAQSKGSFEFGAGTDNPSVTSTDPAALRDQIISAVSGQTVTTAGVSGTPCTNIINHHVEEKRDANNPIPRSSLRISSTAPSSPSLKKRSLMHRARSAASSLTALKAAASSTSSGSSTTLVQWPTNKTTSPRPQATSWTSCSPPASIGAWASPPPTLTAWASTATTPTSTPSINSASNNLTKTPCATNAQVCAASTAS